VTGADFTGVDIDLLADYVGGALEGTPDAARVAALIVDDPAWRDAHALLSDGMAEVGDALNAWGEVPEPMPAEVAARLEEAFAGTGDVAPASPGRHLTVVRETGVDRETARRPQPRRRVLRWGAQMAAAAAVLACAGVGLNYIKSSTSATDSASSSSAGSGVAAQAAAGSASMPGASEITNSGTDYSRSSLAAAPSAALLAPDSTEDSGAPRVESSPAAPTPRATANSSSKEFADPLARLRPQVALRACLDAIAAANGAGPITVQTVDYARYYGKPALIVRFTAGNGSWAWASGADCGLTSVDASTRASVQVG
jgi:hypothetical protein